MSKNINQFKGHIDKYLHNRVEDCTSPLQLLDYYVEEEVQGKSSQGERKCFRYLIGA